MSGPDPSKPLPTATAIFREPPEDLSFHTNFSELVGRFAAESGGGLTPELSADLALEIVLNEIVEQACRVTGATGAAIVLDRDGDMVCRASSGATAPLLGSHVDTQSGLAAECLRTRRTQCCDDTLSDYRADAQASLRVGVRSVVAMPLLRGQEVAGLFELFSTQPFAFGVRDERALEVLADHTLDNLHQASLPQAAEPLPPELAVEPEAYIAPEVPVAPALQLSQEFLQPSEPAESIEPAEFIEQADLAGVASDAPIPDAPRQLDLVVWFLGVAVLAAAILLGVALGRRLAPTRADADRAVPPVQASQPEPAAPVARPAADGATLKPAQLAAKPSSPPRPSSRSSVPPGGLLVLENGREVFRMAPTQNAAGANGGVQLASELGSAGVAQVPEETAVRELVNRVEPEYPEAARQQSIQGPVVLDVRISPEGSVQEVRVVSGAPLLAQASTQAVKLWKFKPHIEQGHPAGMQTRITLNFRLDQ